MYAKLLSNSLKQPNILVGVCNHLGPDFRRDDDSERLFPFGEYLVKFIAGPLHVDLINSSAKVTVVVRKQVLLCPDSDDNKKRSHVPESFEVESQLSLLFFGHVVKVLDSCPFARGLDRFTHECQISGSRADRLGCRGGPRLDASHPRHFGLRTEERQPERAARLRRYIARRRRTAGAADQNRSPNICKNLLINLCAGCGGTALDNCTFLLRQVRTTKNGFSLLGPAMQHDVSIALDAVPKPVV